MKKKIKLFSLFCHASTECHHLAVSVKRCENILKAGT